jgi:hypothetical protein
MSNGPAQWLFFSNSIVAFDFWKAMERTAIPIPQKRVRNHRYAIANVEDDHMAIKALAEFEVDAVNLELSWKRLIHLQGSSQRFHNTVLEQHCNHQFWFLENLCVGSIPSISKTAQRRKTLPREKLDHAGGRSVMI